MSAVLFSFPLCALTWLTFDIGCIVLVVFAVHGGPLSAQPGSFFSLCGPPSCHNVSQYDNIARPSLKTDDAVAPPRWELVRSSAAPVIDEAQSKPHGIGGFETGSFVRAGSTYHAYINELPNQMPWARCPELWWDASTMLGHWTAPSAFGPWVRESTVRMTPAAQSCNGSFNFSACDLTKPPVQTWNSGGLLFSRNSVNGSAKIWNLFYGNRWAVSTTPGEEAGAAGPWVDVACIPSGGLLPGQPARPVPTYQLRNGSWRGFWQGDWPNGNPKNCTWPCHKQRLVGLTGSDSAVIGAKDWTVLPTGQLGNALPLVWQEETPNVENPVVIRSTDGKEFLMVFDALSMNATCRNDPACGWVGGQCWSGTSCNAIGLGWSEDGSNWENVEHVVVQVDPANQCGLIRTPLGIVPEPHLCAGCYSVIYTGWGRSAAATEEANATSSTAAPHHRLMNGSSSRLGGHALPRGHCPPGDARCAVYQGFKPVCAALIRDTRVV